MNEHSVEIDALTDAERAALHRPHIVPINQDWRDCPLCPAYVAVVENILATRVIPAESCPTPGCPGDIRYAAPGRNHIEGCTYPTPSRKGKP